MAVRPLPTYVRERGKELLDVIQKATDAAQMTMDSTAHGATLGAKNSAQTAQTHVESVYVDAVPDLWSQVKGMGFIHSAFEVVLIWCI
jgi:hypothetical protein